MLQINNTNQCSAWKDNTKAQSLKLCSLVDLNVKAKVQEPFQGSVKIKSITL